MPSTSFIRGIKKGKLLGKEFRGVLLDMLVLLHCGQGRALLKKSRSQWFKMEEQVRDWSKLVELMLTVCLLETSLLGYYQKKILGIQVARCVCHIRISRCSCGVFICSLFILLVIAS